MKLILTGIAVCIAIYAQAQHTFKVILRSQNYPVAYATIHWKEQNKSVTADSIGIGIIHNIPDGRQTFLISAAGVVEKEITYVFPLSPNKQIEITLDPEGIEPEVIITATRTSRTISNTPTRVEVISGEELDEKANMKPGDIRMMLSESTGIQTQQTSATSYNSSIRIQGLDGRYTQILRDGYPLYAGFSGGLSIMQIAPLDLSQVEVIKGSSSTLYGGGAIAGLVNLVSKMPTTEREFGFMANGTSAKGLDLSSFYSQRHGKAGITLYGSANYSSPYDPGNTGLTAIPKFERYTINPRLFLYGKHTTASIGFSYITEDRIGGNIDYIKNGTTGYFEENNTDRFTTQAGLAYQSGERSTFNFKNSYTRFNRLITIPSYQFEGLQQSSFTEATYKIQMEKTVWVVGVNFLTDDFTEKRHTPTPLRNYHFNTYGAFLQNSWSPAEVFTLETGLRGDFVSEYGFELLPRVSALWKPTSRLSFRLGAGLGYKTPTVFNEEAERIQFQQILPITAVAINERSAGVNFDINYRIAIGEASLSINQLFFYTRLNKPLILTTTGNGLSFMNATGHIDTKGMETNIKFIYTDFKLFVGYTLAHVNNHFNSVKTRLPLTARHRLNNVLMYEKEDEWKLGLEAYYTSKQLLNDGRSGRSYWVTGFMIEKLWKKISLFINFENFTNTRQTRFDTIYTGSIDNPIFRDIYAPVDGFIINGGIKLRL
ncbi:MAG: TonB-dependent receptor [Chitinophagaceae bacterium]|nr:TonB-dependent receptor [Chitinophagaceae bacterium]